MDRESLSSSNYCVFTFDGPMFCKDFLGNLKDEIEVYVPRAQISSSGKAMMQCGRTERGRVGGKFEGL
jgi:hypothetical protein